MTVRQINTRSALVTIDSGVAVKRFHRHNAGLYRRELAWLRAFANSGYTSRLVDHSEADLSITTEYAGEPISAENAPSDWKRQASLILECLVAGGCHHGDLLAANILVKDGRLTVIDFASATELGSGKPHKKKRVFSDAHMPSRIHYSLFGFPEGSEVHAFTVWNSAQADAVEREIATRLPVIDRITFSPLIYTDYCDDRASWLKKFYNLPELHGSAKAKIPFDTIVVLSTAPEYAPRRRVFAPETRIVNTEVFDLKCAMRAGREGVLHASDNLEEARRNLRWLSYDDDSLPYRYVTMSRPKFASVADVFSRLNALEGIRYVLLRKPSEVVPGEDYDILCDDYFAVKRALGGMAYKNTSNKFFQNVGASVDEGGFKVAHHVLVNGTKVPFDIRYVGDRYFPRHWQERMLERRVLRDGVYVCAPDDEFLGKSYHALFHKVSLPKKYADYFGKALNISDPRDLRRALVEMTCTRLAEDGCSTARPNDLTMAYNPPALTDYAARREFFFVRGEIRKCNFSGASKILLNYVKVHGPSRSGMYWTGRLLRSWSWQRVKQWRAVHRRNARNALAFNTQRRLRSWLLRTAPDAPALREQRSRG